MMIKLRRHSQMNINLYHWLKLKEQQYNLMIQLIDLSNKVNIKTFIMKIRYLIELFNKTTLTI